MYLSTRSYASDSSSPISISILSPEIAILASLSASSFPLMPMWLGSQMKFIFLLYLRIKSKISVRRFGLLILLPDDIACRALYESLNMQCLLRFDDFYTHIAVELRSRRLIIVRTLVLDVLPLSKMLTQSCRLHFD